MLRVISISGMVSLVIRLMVFVIQCGSCRLSFINNKVSSMLSRIGLFSSECQECLLFIQNMLRLKLLIDMIRQNVIVRVIFVLLNVYRYIGRFMLLIFGKLQVGISICYFWCLRCVVVQFSVVMQMQISVLVRVIWLKLCRFIWVCVRVVRIRYGELILNMMCEMNLVGQVCLRWIQI